jgi:hypothetical protein
MALGDPDAAARLLQDGGFVERICFLGAGDDVGYAVLVELLHLWCSFQA